MIQSASSLQSMFRRPGRLPWVLLVLWSTWLFTLQGRLAAGSLLGAWVPDLGLLLILSLDARVPRPLAWRVALVVGLARIATSADPPLAILVGYWGVVGLAGPLREIVLLDGPLLRTFFAGLMALAVGALLISAQRAQEPLAYLGASVFESTWRNALATGIWALLLLPLLRLLPGLSPLQRERL